MREQKLMIALLSVIAILLALNLVVGSGGFVKPALADIVEGKNVFSTTSPDGSTVYIWGYTQKNTLDSSTVEAEYFGKISVGGNFVAK